MKQIILLAAVLLFSIPAFAQDAVLPAGQYLLISDVKDGMVMEKCEITTDKDGTFVTFPAPSGHPELALKPLRAFIQGANIQFSIGPGDYVQGGDKVRWDITIYRGQVSNGTLKGDVCDDGVTKVKFGKFLLFKP